VDTTTTPSDEPPRPDVVPADSDGRRRWFPTVVVFLVMAGTVLGGFVVASALSTPAGPPVDVGGIVRVQPLSGWEAANATKAGGLPFTRLTRGGGALDVVTIPSFGDDDASLADRYANEVLAQQLSGLSFSERLRSVLVAGGQAAERFDYVGVTDTGASVEGEVTVLVTPTGDGVAFDGWAPEGLLTFVEGDVHTMEDEAVLT
jgi:hypothetical protein